MRMIRPCRGSLLIGALMLFAVLLALGLGIMSGQSARMKAAQAQTDACQAKALCDAAWQDVRVKLGKDLLFPLPTRGQDYFAYSEDVYAPDPSGREEIIGSYTVILDVKLEATKREFDDLGLDTEVALPKGIYQITCIGKVGPRAAAPEAEREIYYELDMETFNVIRIEDKGSI